MALLLRADRIHKSFPQASESLPVICDLSLTLQEGEIVALLGASGCGKTTLLSILAGLDHADEGKITCDLARPGPDIGFMQQKDLLLPWRTVAANMGLGLEFKGTPSTTIAVRTAEILAAIGLADFAQAWPSQLSGGMQQRVMLGRILAMTPKILLLDEPLGHLDIVGRRDMAALVRHHVTRHRGGAIVVTHSVEEAMFIADRILVLAQRPTWVVEELRREDGFERVLNCLMKAIGGTDDV